MLLQRRDVRLIQSASVIALIVSGAPLPVSAQSPQNSSLRAAALEEVVVTAQKREELLLEVPVPITAVAADQLLEVGYSDLRDYFMQAPNVTIQLGNSGAPTVAIRGITTGVFSTPTVATVIDDIPYGGNSLFAAGFATPEVDPSDLARLEVLRGPQGTLYGAATLGGLLKFVTVDPSTEGVSGMLQTTATSVAHGDELGYAVRGAVNMPVSDTLAVRVSGYTRLEPGWIDNVQTGAKDVNELEASGARVSALWQPSETTSLKVGALYQERRRDGTNYVEPTLGEYAQSTMPGTGWLDQQLKSLTATLRASLGEAQFTSLTGYAYNTFEDRYDYSRVFLGTAQNFGFPAAQGVTLEEHVTTKKFSQELRFDVPVGERMDLLVGAFFTNENSDVPQAIKPTDSQATPIGVFSANLPISAFTEYAVFANARYRLTDRLELQVGGRYAMIDQQLSVSFTGLSPRVAPPVTTEDRPFTFLVTPKYQLTDDAMLYARFASGYRPGGPNTPSAVAFLPPFSPDETMNYELGFKGEFVDGAWVVDASVFYTDWEDVLLQYIDPVSRGALYLNGETARSQGVELSTTIRPLEGLRLTGWAAFTDATLTENLGSDSVLFGREGDRLPTSPRWSGMISADYDFPVSASFDVFAGVSASYVGERIGPLLRDASARQELDDYTQIDAKLGIRAGSVRATAFVTNLTDERGVLRGGVGVTFPFAFYYIEPRTIGLTLSKDF
ncbi:MAG TPA: TonB-dependent receptor [Steroidobacteraceae bacterium]|nr:TonB-dependent receptor [Steroidobacteraceae bacterium]